jgi:hypothetical protein
VRVLDLSDLPHRPIELHETRSATGLSALIVEGDLDIGAPGEQVDPGDV